MIYRQIWKGEKESVKKGTEMSDSYRGGLNWSVVTECKNMATYENMEIPRWSLKRKWHLTTEMLTSCPDRMTFTFCHRLSVETLYVTKYFSCSCSLAMNSVPGVMQFESNHDSDGRASPRSRALCSRISASLADRNLEVISYFSGKHFYLVSLYIAASVRFVSAVI
jgi:hypothetical protein